MTATPLLRVANVSKSFPGQRALDDVELEVAAGEVHALVGQNGSGKSTLIKILTEYHRPDPGARAWVRGEATSFHDLAGTVPIRAVHQDLGIIGGLNAVDNIAIGAGYVKSTLGNVNWRRQRGRTADLLSRIAVDEVDITRPLDQAPPLHRTVVAIARVMDAWDGRTGILILDEPTSALPDYEVDRLLAIVRELRTTGVSVLYVSHALDEIVDVADRVTVLKEGRRVATRQVAGLGERGLMSLMLGEEALADLDRAESAQSSARRDATVSGGPAVLEVERLCGVDLAGVSFSAGSGEVLGVAGLLGSGHLEIAYIIGGAQRGRGGRLRVADRAFDPTAISPAAATRLGVGFVPPDRAREGAIAQLPVGTNVSLPALRRFRRAGRIHRRAERSYVGERIRDLEVVPADPAMKVESLSGGNRQKVVLAKWLGIATKVLVLAEPTVGVDVGAKMNIYQRIRRAAADGLTVIVCSTDVTDLVAACDRVLALSDGLISAELSGPELTEQNILRAISTASATVPS